MINRFVLEIFFLIVITTLINNKTIFILIQIVNLLSKNKTALQYEHRVFGKR